MTKKVIVFQRRLTHYRVPLFETLRSILKSQDIDFNLVYGQPTLLDACRMDCGALPWASVVKNRYWRVLGKDLTWQPTPIEAVGADLIIVPQENSLLSNYPMLIKRHMAGSKIAFWGHGKNYQSDNPSSLREKWKQVWLKKVDWWFAYSELTVAYLVKMGYPSSRISCLNNATDSKSFCRDLDSITNEQLVALRTVHCISERAKIGLFCGSLDAHKKFNLLVDAAELIHEARPDFLLVVIGDGPRGTWLREQAASRPWIRILGVKYGWEKAAWFRLASIILNPGMVGLPVLDAFAAGLPLITTSNARHSPEIVYLQHNRNGLISGDTPVEFSVAALNLLSDKPAYDRLAQNAKTDNCEYTIENMAREFSKGIVCCLNVQ